MSGETSIVIQEGNERFELSPQIVTTIGEIAARNNLDVASAIQMSIVNEKFIMELEADGWRLIVNPRRGQYRYLKRT